MTSINYWKHITNIYEKCLKGLSCCYRVTSSILASFSNVKFNKFNKFIKFNKFNNSRTNINVNPDFSCIIVSNTTNKIVQCYNSELRYHNYIRYVYFDPVTI